MKLLERITPEICQANRDTIYVFGDNLLRKGKAGQACIRDEPNAFGIPTKRLPSMNSNAFFSDKPDEFMAVLQAVQQLHTRVKNTNCDVVFPSAGLGTGLARMKEKSPEVFAYMNALLEIFNGS